MTASPKAAGVAKPPKTGAERVRDSMQRKRDEGWRMYQIFCSPEDQRAIEKARKESTLAAILVAGAAALNRDRGGRR